MDPNEICSRCKTPNPEHPSVPVEWEAFADGRLVCDGCMTEAETNEYLAEEADFIRKVVRPAAEAERP